MSPRSKFSVLIALAALLAGGCGSDNGGPLAPEADETLYREGQQLEKEGRSEEALNDYLKLIARREDQAPQSHLEAGILYLDTFKDPISAIYHLEEFLKLEPNSPQASFVRGQIEAAKREFASTLPASSWEEAPVVAGGGSGAAPAPAGQADLVKQIESLQAANDALKAQLADLRAAEAGSVSLQPPAAEPAPVPAAPPVALVRETPPEPSPQADAAGRRIHVVAPGDNLSKISREYYHDSVHVREIIAANPRQLPDGKATPLHPGMRLVIP